MSAAGGLAAAAPAPKQRRLTSIGARGRSRGGGRRPARRQRQRTAVGTRPRARAAAQRRGLRGLQAGIKEAAAAESTRRQIEKLQAREAQQTSNAQRLLRDALPTVEGMLQSATRELTQHAPRATTRQSDQSDATRQSELAVGELRRVISRDRPAHADRGLGAARDGGARRAPVAAAARHAGGAAGRPQRRRVPDVARARDRQHRRTVLGNLSLVLLYRIQRVCSDLRLWSRATLPTVGPVTPLGARLVDA